MPLPSTSSHRHDRLEIAALLEERQAALAQGQSERAFFRSAPIARSTLRDEVHRQQDPQAAPEVATFYASTSGQMHLMRLVLATHFVMTLLGPCGVPLVRTWLLLAGLSPFVGTSYGAQQKVALWLQQQVAEFGREEHERLGSTMPRKKLWLCEDETFFPGMVLVAIEALSDFLVVERYAEHRDAATWTTVVKESLAGLPVEVEGVTADGAKGIAAHAKQAFGLAVTPDVFHVQHDVTQGTAAALASRVRALEEAWDKAQQERDKKAMASALAEARDHQQRMAAAIEGLGEAYRPYDERTGEIRRGDQVRAELHEMLDEATDVANAAGLSKASHEGIGKARRAVAAMAAAVEGYHERVTLSLQALHVPAAIGEAMQHQVLPALYLHKVARQSSDSEAKRRLHEQANTLIAPLQEEDTSPMRQLTEVAVADLLHQGSTWVERFERSSSRVEGRNGQLELHHHSLHGLSEAKLSALTVVRNFWVRREDGSTAAEKFFEQKPRDLFEALLDVMPDLPRPAQKRPRVAPSPLLN